MSMLNLALKWLRINKTDAALELPPPRPEPIGIFFLKNI